MKYGKYVVAVLVVAALGTGGAVVASHQGNHKTTASVKVKYHAPAKAVSIKKASTSSKVSSSSVKPQSSSPAVSSSVVASSAVASSSSVVAASVAPTSDTDTQATQQPAQTTTPDTQVEAAAPAQQVPADQTQAPAPADTQTATDNTTSTDNNQQVSDPTLTQYVNTYGMSPERYHEVYDGMTQQQAQAATPDTQKTSGELQTEWLQKQGLDTVTGQPINQNN